MAHRGTILRTLFALGLSLCLATAQMAPKLSADLNTAPSPEGSFPFFGGALPDGGIVFAARRSAEGLELCLLSASGATLIKDIDPGPKGSNPRGFASLGTLVQFNANNGTHGSKLWRTDGTAQGTVMVVDVEPGASGSLPSELVVGPKALDFRNFATARGSELWKTDGTANGKMLVLDAKPGTIGSRVTRLVGDSARLDFFVDDGITGLEL